MLCAAMVLSLAIGLNTAVSAEGEKTVNVKITVDIPSSEQFNMSDVKDVTVTFFWADKGADNWTAVTGNSVLTTTNFSSDADIQPAGDEFNIMASVVVHSSGSGLEYATLNYGVAPDNSILSDATAVTASSDSNLVITKSINMGDLSNLDKQLKTPDEIGGIWSVRTGYKPEYNIGAVADPEFGSATASASYPANSVVKLTATPKDNGRFTGWVKGENAVGSNFDLYVMSTSNNTYTATFEELNISDVEVLNRTANTITIKTVAGQKYMIGSGEWTEVFTSSGTYTFTGLDKGTEYEIRTSADGAAVSRSVTAATSYMDALEIAKMFNIRNEVGTDAALFSTRSGSDLAETAENPIVKVTVGEKRNYLVTLLSDVDQEEANYDKNDPERSFAAVLVSTDWGNSATIDLNGHKIVGVVGNSTFPKGGSGINVVPGKVGFKNFNLEIINNGSAAGSILGGDGYENSGKAGGSGIWFTEGAEDGTLTVSGAVDIKGGNGADRRVGVPGDGGNGVTGNITSASGTVNIIGGNGGESERKDGGAGGIGVAGRLLKISGNGTVKGGNGGFSLVGKGGDGGAAVKNADDDYSFNDTGVGSVKFTGGNGADGYTEGGKGAEAFKNCTYTDSKGRDGETCKDSVDRFISNYLKAEDGSIYNSVDDRNAAKIAGGENDWNALSASAKRMIDEQIGASYEELLAKAKELTGNKPGTGENGNGSSGTGNNGKTGTDNKGTTTTDNTKKTTATTATKSTTSSSTSSPKTGDESNVILWTVIMTLGLAAMSFIGVSAYRKTKSEN